MECYLDNSATTRCLDSAAALMAGILCTDYGNPSSLHHKGVQAEEYVRHAREVIAKTLKVTPKEIFFTSGGTESDNLALRGAAYANARQGKHLITTSIEHPAILNTMQYLEQQGFEVTYLQPDETGFVSVEALKAALRPDTILVSIMMVNNESGAVMPIERMARLTHRVCPDAIFHTDAVQGFFKVSFRASTLGADAISVSGHKIHASKGVGALYLRPGLNLPPLIYGGGQESKLRSGTEMLPLIAGFAAACEAKLPTRQHDIAEQNRLTALCRELVTEIDGVTLLGAQEAPHIVNLAVRGLRSQGLINALQDRDVYVSAGSACSKGHRSHVLEAMGAAPELIDGSIRVSLSDETTEDDIRAFASALEEAIAALR